MKLYGNISQAGNKAKYINKLYQEKVNIPETCIINVDHISKFNTELLNKNKKYILRPSFNLEDGKIFSYAGYFKSIYPMSIQEIVHILSLKNINNIFGGKGHKLCSIIIQEYINAKSYGVYFTRDPKNIFHKGFYELGNENNTITSGKFNTKKKLNILLDLELKYLGEKIENIFNSPQDIEFCILNNKILILQSRNITTGNEYNYSLKEIKKLNGYYHYLDFDELGTEQDYFSYHILKKLFPCILIENKIYFKSFLFPFYLWKKMKSNNHDLNNFLQNYQIYLKYKIIYGFLRFFIPQKLDIKVLNNLFKNYSYSFLLNKRSFLGIKFSYKTNFITKKFIKLEKQKQKSFIYLEKYKESYKNGNLIYNDKKKNTDFLPPKKLLFFKGNIIIKDISNHNYQWIYKSKIQGFIVDLKTIKYTKKHRQIIILDNLTIDLYPLLEYLDGVIIKNGNQLSHNSIILREYKIPSIINYKNYSQLVIGKEITIQ